MTVPGRLTIYAAALLVALSLLAVVMPHLALLTFIGDAALLALAVFDALLLRRTAVEVHPIPPARMVANEPCDIGYRAVNTSRHTLCFLLRQTWPTEIRCAEEKLSVTLRSGEQTDLLFNIIPAQRGPTELPIAQGAMQLALPWARRLFPLPPMPPQTVFPATDGIRKYEILRRHRALAQVGVHRLRLVGAGREFEQLRDYGPDDEYRNINWKATARRGKLVATTYQTERSQDVILCIDSSRMMGTPAGDKTALDYAVDAAVVLAHASSRQQDRVGLILFSETLQTALKPATGARAVADVVRRLAAARSTPVYPSFGLLGEALRSRFKRRSMVFLFTDLNDPQLVSNMRDNLLPAARRHFLTIISLRDALIDRVAAGAPENSRGLYQVLAANALTQERQQTLAQLRYAGAHVLQAHADSLSMAVINRYLEIKARQQL